jgi:hypothetical protein
MTDSTKKDNKDKEAEPLPGYLMYPESEDIYNKGKKEQLEEEKNSELDKGLDVPGAELDDADEAIGEEDEENNYYSLGGDDHNDLDETEDE